MILDYVEKTGAFILRVPRANSADIQELMHTHGLDLSVPLSTPDQAVLFTREAYAAVSFAEYGTPLAREKLKGLLVEIEASRALTDNGHYDVPCDKELWPFQKADLAYALRRQNTLIGDEPGLGKTAIGITFANEIKAKRALVVCPASIRLQWYSRIHEWSTLPWPRRVHPVITSKNGVDEDAHWLVASYEMARTPVIARQLAKLDYDVMILDEAHYLKTINSRRTRAIMGGGDNREFDPIADKAAHILALTGTPLPNRPREAYTLARGLCWDSIDWASEDTFSTRFNPSRKMETVDPATGKTRIWIDERSGRHAELQNRLRANFMSRHLKREVMTQLKLPVYDLVQCEETRAVKQALAAESLLHIDPENLEGADASVLGQIATVRRLMGVALAPQVAAYIHMLLDGGEDKLVVFAWHKEVLDILEQAWIRHGVVRVDGRTTPGQKDRLVQQFITDPSCHVILGNVLSLGTGTDGLQLVSSHALIAEPSWVPGENIQCFDRLDRGGQQCQVQGDIFVAPNSFAEKVLASALRKARVTHQALDQRW